MSAPRPSTGCLQQRTMLAVLLSIALLLPQLARPVVAAGVYDWQVQQMYIAYYGRPGDPAGVDYWAERLAEAGGNWISDLVNAFGNSAEYIQRFGPLGDASLIDNLYQQLFNRSAEPIGLRYYVDLLNGTNSSDLNPSLRQSTLAQIALDIANGAQGDDGLILGNKRQVAEYFSMRVSETGTPYDAGDIDTAVELLAAVGLSAASVAKARSAIERFVDTVAGTFRLNDTGIDWCANESTNFIACSVAGYSGQDAQDGRDVTHNDSSDGHAGFSFTKLDANGDDLPASATNWYCVRDNVTGLIWEVKTDDGGLRDKDWTYSWYNPDPATNGGSAGYADIGDNCFESTRCDTANYVDDVNATGLCGASDWRAPSVDELLSIVSNDREYPSIDLDYFPNTVSRWFWSSSPYAYRPNFVWDVLFGDGHVGNSTKNSWGYIRLIRAGQ